MAHSPPPKLWYLRNHRDALQARMHFLHKLGIAKTEANYHAYYQTLIKDGTANGATSNAYLTSSDVPFNTNCIIMKYRTNQCGRAWHFSLIQVTLAFSKMSYLCLSRQRLPWSVLGILCSTLQVGGLIPFLIQDLVCVGCAYVLLQIWENGEHVCWRPWLAGVKSIW
jgi:hypothetical protein